MTTRAFCSMLADDAAEAEDVVAVRALDVNVGVLIFFPVFLPHEKRLDLASENEVFRVFLAAFRYVP